jgi:porphobilinogen synthase
MPDPRPRSAGRATTRPLRVRPRRLRRTPALREWVAETSVEVRRLVYPVFVRPGVGNPRPVRSMPGVEQYSLTDLAGIGGDLEQEGVRAVLLFGIARKKFPDGREAWAPDGLIPRAVRELKRAAPGVVIATDVCLCAYTSNGHCGIVRRGDVDNDATNRVLGRVAVAHADAGADVVAPSAMMDGQVGALRDALDSSQHEATAIWAYSTKHASAFYGPFREVERSTPSFGDRRGYQMDPRNAREALREMALDEAEGADLLMVKPALTSLDLLARARRRTELPLAAFQVSGEYAMIKAAAQLGILDEDAAVQETLGAIRRAGADLIVTYFARDVARRAKARP